ncbi:MAG: FkbM family methyltransferase [Acidobacteriota bacterium]
MEGWYAALLVRGRLKRILDALGLLPAARSGAERLRALSPARRAKARRRRARRLRAEALYAEFLGPDDLCFDIGANVGARVEIFRALGARVIAAEPDTRCLEILHRRFDGDPQVVLVSAGLGAAEGEAEFFVSSDRETSSMSAEWIAAVRERLSEFTWAERRTVKITTLDALVAQHGRPAFCKIDVEGFELEVLRGLSTALPCLSFEYTPERLDPALEALDRLSSLGDYVFSFSREVDFVLDGGWVDAATLARRLRGERDSGRSGDVYARRIASGRS